jgi:hypothetical protein
MENWIWNHFWRRLLYIFKIHLLFVIIFKYNFNFLKVINLVFYNWNWSLDQQLHKRTFTNSQKLNQQQFDVALTPLLHINTEIPDLILFNLITAFNQARSFQFYFSWNLKSKSMFYCPFSVHKYVIFIIQILVLTFRCCYERYMKTKIIAIHLWIMY